MMDLELRNKIVCITGGSRGIGLATASLFAKQGAIVIIAARDPERLHAASEYIYLKTGKKIEIVTTDVTQNDDLDGLKKYIETQHGRLDVLVNNAGTGIYKPFSEVDDDDLNYGMSINFFAQFKLTQRTLELLKKSDAPVVINISGRTALRGNFPPGSSCTGPAKAAEVRFSIDLATELSSEGIRVNCIVPGVIKSEDRFNLWESQALDQSLSENEKKVIRKEHEADSVPVGQQWGSPEDVANAVVFLSSAKASYINGVALTVDGGPHNKSYITQLYKS